MPDSMAKAVTWDVADLTLNYLDETWGTLAPSSDPSKPDKFRLFNEDEDGNPKKGWDPAGHEYVMVREIEDSRIIDWTDGPRDVADLSAAALVRSTTPSSRARRTELHDELLVLYENIRKRSSNALGSWDTVTLDGPLRTPDEDFNFWLVEMTLLFEKKGVVLS